VIAYFDSSALVKRLFAEPGADLADEIWESADTVVSSQLIYPEVRAAAAAAHRAGKAGARDLPKVVHAIDEMCGMLEIIRVDRRLAIEAGDLAGEHALRGYDAVHLASALNVPAPRVLVATWDKQLAVAATRSGVGVLPFQPAFEAA
jgi:uncharacterized protein